MPGAVIVINQPTGAGAGTPGIARKDLWQAQQVELSIGTGGNTDPVWTLLSVPAGSAASLSSPTSLTCNFTPDLVGTYRIRLQVNGGGPGNVQTLVARVRRNSSGVLVNRGWAYPAVGELQAEANYDGNTRGWAEVVETILEDVRINGFSGGGGGGSSNIILYDEGAPSPGGNLYDNFSDAFTAASAIQGEVTILFLGITNMPVLPAGVFDADNRITLKAISTAAWLLPLEVSITDGFVLRNPHKLVGLYFPYAVTTAWLTTDPLKPMNLELYRSIIYATGTSAPAASLPSGLQSYLTLLNDSTLDGDDIFTTLAAGKVLNINMYNGAYIGTKLVSGVAGTLNVSYDGASFIENQLSYSGTFTRSDWLIARMAQIQASIGFNSQRLTNVATPVTTTDAANKAYVDSVASGLDIKQSVRAATTASITLSGLQTIDGVALLSGERVLVKNQASPAQNGIYNASAGAWGRASDADTNAEVNSGMFCFVEEGTSNGGTGWVLTTANPISLNTTPLSFSQFSSPGELLAGAGLLKTGNTFYVQAADGTIQVNLDSIQAVPSAIVTESVVRTALGNSLGPVPVNGQVITNLSYPLLGFDAATRDWVDGTDSVNGAGSGTLNLTLANTAYGFLEVTGLLTGDRTIKLPNSSRQLTIFNNTTGDYQLIVEGFTSGKVYVPRGRIRRVYQDSSNVLRAEAQRSMELEFNISLIGHSTGNNDVVVCTLPGPVVVEKAELLVTQAPTVSVTLSLGVSGTFDQLIAATAATTLNQAIGFESAHAGSDLSGKTGAYYSSAQTLTLRDNIGSGTLLAGSVRLFLYARYLGDLPIPGSFSSKTWWSAPSTYLRSYRLGELHARYGGRGLQPSIGPFSLGESRRLDNIHCLRGCTSYSGYSTER